MPEIGAKIELAAQAYDNDTGLFVRGRVFDATDTELTGSPVTLAHVSNGLYTNHTLVMPNSERVHAVYEAFLDAGFTMPSPEHCHNTESFEIDKSVSVLDDIAVPPGETTLISTNADDSTTLTVDAAGNSDMIAIQSPANTLNVEDIETSTIQSNDKRNTLTSEDC